MDGKLVLRVDHNSTYVEGRMSSEIYDKFKRELGYLPENSFWMIKNNSDKAKEHEKWKKEWDGNISAVCWNKQFCHCHVKKSGLHFQTGLLSKAVNFLRSNNVPFRRIDNRSKTLKTDAYSMSEEFEFRDYQQDVINKVVGTKQTEGIDRGIIKVATGGGKCIDKESLCLTEDGLLTFGEMCKEDMKVGDYVSYIKKVRTPIDYDGYDESSHIYYDGERGDSIRVNTMYGYNVVGTQNHLIKVLTSEGLKWKKLKDIKIGDYAAIYRGSMCFGSDETLSELDAYWLGMLYGDGCVTSKNSVRLTTQDDHIENFARKYAKVNNLKICRYDDKRTKLTRSLNIHSVEYRSKLLNMGVGYDHSYEKTIPLIIRKSSAKVVSMFLRGLYETDGYVTNEKSKPTVNICLSSEKFIRQLHVMLLNFGIVSSFRRKQTKKRDCFILTIYRDSICVFNEYISFDNDGYKAKQIKESIDTIKSLQQNTNTDIIPNQKNTFKEIRSLLRISKGYHNLTRTIESLGVNKRTFDSWMEHRNPSRKSVKEFATNLLKINNEENTLTVSSIHTYAKFLLDICDDFFFTPIESKEICNGDNYDFVIPKTHSFVSQGFVNHNTAISAGIVANMGVSPTIMYVPSIDLLRQAKDELEKFVRCNNLGIKVGMIGGGSKDIQDINVMTVQTAVRSLGGVWVKFDDEDNTKDDTNIEDIKTDVKDLIRGSKLMLCDEVQHWAAETCQIISDASESCQYRYGLSVFSESTVELRGEYFSEGYSCSIEEAWNKVVELKYGKPFRDREYEIVNVKGIESRGWENGHFVWKKVKRFIRHINDRNSYSVRFAGSERINMTEDHSIFRIKNNKIEECTPDKLSEGELLLIDNGNNIYSKQKVPNAIDILSYNPKKMRVGIDLSGVTSKQLNISESRYRQLIKRGKMAERYGGSLYLKDYVKYKDILPSPKWIYVEGSNDTGISADLNIEDISYLLGFYIGDGWVDGTRLNFAVEKSFIESFLEKIDSIKKIKINPKIRDIGKGSVEIRSGCRPLVDFVNFYFSQKKCYEKDIPNEFLFNSRDVKLKLIEGLIDSDGSRKKTKDDKIRNRQPCSFTTTSTKLKDNFCLLLRGMGVPYTVSERMPRLGGIIDGRQIFGRRISYQILWSDNALFENNEGRKGKTNKTKINCIEKRVLEVTPIQNDGYVYDLEMDGHPSFVANGVLVHNSATPYRDKGDDILIEGCFGRTIADISASFLIKRNYLIRPTIYFFKINNMRGLRKSSYANIYKQAIIENTYRNQQIVEMANRFLTSGRKTLILVKQIKHGKLLEDLIPESAFIHGGTGKKKRASHLNKMREGCPQVTIASVIFDEGIDVRPLNTLILAGGGKSPTRALQRIGRILRPFEGKTDAIAVDFMDNCKYMQSHSKKRLNIYKTEEEFNIVGD